MRIITVLAALMAAGCALDPLGPAGGGPSGRGPVTLDSADLRVLFLGNSLTYTNDLPGVVARLAEAAGLSFAEASLTGPGWSLEEHWNAGAADRIREARADFVVLQQGPSSLASSRSHLVYWTAQLAPSIREAGGEPALYMVWPEQARIGVFPDVRASYAAAAEGVDGVFIPAGQAWVEAWELDPALRLYGGDAFHPSYLGTLAAAMTILAVLGDIEPDDLPDLADDAASAADVATLRAAVAAALAGEAAASRSVAPGGAPRID